MPWVETGAAVSREYGEAREEASDYARARNVYFEQVRQHPEGSVGRLFSLLCISTKRMNQSNVVYASGLATTIMVASTIAKEVVLPAVRSVSRSWDTATETMAFPMQTCLCQSPFCCPVHRTCAPTIFVHQAMRYLGSLMQPNAMTAALVRLAKERSDACDVGLDASSNHHYFKWLPQHCRDDTLVIISGAIICASIANDLSKIGAAIAME